MQGRNAAQDSQNEFATPLERRTHLRRLGPITFYAPLLASALVTLVIVHSCAAVYLDMIGARMASQGGNEKLIALLSTWTPRLNAALAVPLGALLLGLAVCGLLYLWLKPRRTLAIVATVALAALWITGLSRYVRGADIPATVVSGFADLVGRPEIASMLITLGLAVGVVVLPALWFIWPFEALPVSLLWLLAWSVLTFGLREYQAGAVLLISAAATVAVSVLGLRLTSRFLLPSPEEETHGRAYSFLRDHVLGMNLPAYVVVDTPHQGSKAEERVPGDRFSQLASGPGFVLSDCDHAVAVSSGIKFKGVQGPGITFTGYADRVMQTVDLRPQLRAFHVEALTKDGIKIRVLAFTPFKIDSRGRQPQLGEAFPYNKGAAFRAIHAQRMEHEGAGQSAERMKQRAWQDLPQMISEHILQDVIGEYEFDDLYGPYQPGGEPPRKVIAQAFRERLAAELEPLGLHLVGGGISDLEPADSRDVYLKRVHSWQADWERKITLRKAEGQAEWLRMVERARAEAQAELILSLGHQLEELSTAGTGFRPDVAVKLLVTILDELMVQQPTVGQIVPGETLQALADIRKALTG